MLNVAMVGAGGYAHQLMKYIWEIPDKIQYQFGYSIVPVSCMLKMVDVTPVNVAGIVRIKPTIQIKTIPIIFKSKVGHH